MPTDEEAGQAAEEAEEAWEELKEAIDDAHEEMAELTGDTGATWSEELEELASQCLHRALNKLPGVANVLLDLNERMDHINARVGRIEGYVEKARKIQELIQLSSELRQECIHSTPDAIQQRMETLGDGFDALADVIDEVSILPAVVRRPVVALLKVGGAASRALGSVVAAYIRRNEDAANLQGQYASYWRGVVREGDAEARARIGRWLRFVLGADYPNVANSDGMDDAVTRITTEVTAIRSYVEDKLDDDWYESLPATPTALRNLEAVFGEESYLITTAARNKFNPISLAFILYAARQAKFDLLLDRRLNARFDYLYYCLTIPSISANERLRRFLLRYEWPDNFFLSDIGLPPPSATP